MAQDERDKAWRAYYDGVAGRPPRPTLIEALDRFGSNPGRAVDLGCGDGRDTIELLRRGWLVTAIDAEPEALARLVARADLPPDGVLSTRCTRFEEAVWPIGDLVNASFVLPLCPPAMFPALWTKIADSLRPGGRFAGQFYGPRDGWADDAAMTIVTEAQARGLLDAYAIERFTEEETDSVTPRGKPKHWHIFHVVARKR